MATTLTQLETQARVHLKEVTASFWTSAELVDVINKGIKDLWGAIIDLNEEHYQTVDESNVSLAANTSSLTGVPTDVFRVLLIEPRDTTTSGSFCNTIFVPRAYNHPDAIAGRAMPALDPTSGLRIIYSVSAAGAPVGAPTIRTQPQVSQAIPLRFVYVPTVTTKVAADDNPIPGESDNALIAWCVAYARAKEREDRSPDPNWLAVYATEKQNLLVRMAPRQTQEPETVDDFFGEW
jgi:hypothetical protein